MEVKRFLWGALAGVTALSVALVATGDADAATQRPSGKMGCPYPYVCLYKSKNLQSFTGRFRDVTSGFQHLSRSRGATSFVNTRRDDVVYLKLSTGKTICARPNSVGGLIPGGGGVIGVRVSWSSRC